MNLNPAEISELIKSRIEGLGVSADVRNQGTVVSVTDGIVRVHGLSDAMQGEMLEFPPSADGQPSYGLALNLERDSVGAVILGEYEHISEGDTVKCTGRILEVPVGPELKGRVVNALGQPIDGKGPIQSDKFRPVERIAPGRETSPLPGGGEMGMGATSSAARESASSTGAMRFATVGFARRSTCTRAAPMARSAEIARTLGLDPARSLARNDSYPFFAALGDLLRPGPTGTNVNDLAFVFLG